MAKKEKQDIKGIEAELRKLVGEIAERRDRIRALYEELDNIYCSVNTAVEELEAAVDTLSEQL